MEKKLFKKNEQEFLHHPHFATLNILPAVKCKTACKADFLHGCLLPLLARVGFV